MRGFQGHWFHRNAVSPMLFLAQGQNVDHSIVIGRSSGHDPAQGISLPKWAFSRPVEYGFKDRLVCVLVQAVRLIAR